MSESRDADWTFEILVRRHGKGLRLQTRWLGGATRERGLDAEGLWRELRMQGFASGPARGLLPPPEPGEAMARWGQRALEAGHLLFDRFLSKEARLQLRNADQTLVKSGGQGLLRLHLPPEQNLVLLPWEMLADPEMLTPFAVSERWVLARALGPIAIQENRAQAGKTHLLVVVAEPRDFPEVDSEAELARLREALEAPRAAGWLSFEVLRSATREKLRDRLRDGKFNALHFLGHGEAAIDEDGAHRAEACLLLETAQGLADPVSGAELGALLDLRPGAPSPLAFVVLNACFGGQPSEGRHFGGVAQRLLQAGLPAAVAMPRPIFNESAIRFTRDLYQPLARGESFAASISAARRAIFAGQQGLEWAVPVLFANHRPQRLEISRLRTMSRPLLALGSPALARTRHRWRTLSRSARAAGLACLLVPFASIGWLAIHQMQGEPPQPLPPEVLVDDPRCPSPKGLTLGLQLIPSGSFEMGDDRSREAAPRHPVILSEPFCIGRTEITRDQWGQVMSAAYQGLLGAGQDGWLPKGGVDYEEAMVFIRQLNRLSGEDVFSLPTEAQWEYAARAGSAGEYSFGDDVKLLPHFANCGRKNQDDFVKAAPVANFRANVWGLYDMQGNLTEWVSDWYKTYSDEEQTDPQGPSRGTKRIRRGGSYLSALDNCRPSHRIAAEPDFGGEEFGLRVARWPVP